MTTEAIAAPIELPEQGVPPDELRAFMSEARRDDVKWRSAKTGPTGPNYFAGDDLLAFSKEVYAAFYEDNAMYKRAFLSAQQFERQIVEMTGRLFHNPTPFGNVTSGGTESIILAMKGARDRARAERPEVKDPEVVAPASAHPAFSKGGHLLGMKVIRTPLTDGFRVDLDAYRRAITPNTVMMVGSAPNHPYGALDPIPEMAAIAAERDINFHTDACLGGFFLPFLEQLGEELRPWDFRVPGVTSISADVHKYGFAPRGNSTISWRDEAHFKYQPFEFDDWPSGTYRTEHLGGSRGSGGIAATWAVMRYLGATGYRESVSRTMGLIRTLTDGIKSVPGLEIFGDPVMSIIAYGSRSLDILAVADGMRQRGWGVDVGKTPHIHIMIFNSLAEPWVDEYVSDLGEVAELVRQGKIQHRTAEARYN